jgi:very-short-patch-repair endonuclease
MIPYRINLTWDAKPAIFENAKTLRKTMTDAEELLWKHLRNKQLNGFKFRRQHPVDIFIADFYCHAKKLIIELDGGIHDLTEQHDYDEGRTLLLEEKGFTILRFNNEVLEYEQEKVL